MDSETINIWGAGALSFLIASLVCLLDLMLVTGDRIECPVHPLHSAESRLFALGNGLLAAFLYLLALGKPHTLEYQLSIGIKWATDDPWSRAILIGLFTIVFVRSKLLTLKENRVLGFDVVYTRCREACIDTLITATLIKQRRIRIQYRDRFLDDKSFTKDFGEFVLEKMRHSKARVVDIKLLDETMKNPVPDNETLTVIHEALIKSALLYISRRNLKTILRNWSEHKKHESQGSLPARLLAWWKRRGN